MDSVFFIIRRQRTSILMEAKQSTSVYQLKRMVEGIVKRGPEEQQLYNGRNKMDDSKTLKDYGFDMKSAAPEQPAVIGLALRLDEGSGFEKAHMEPFSAPPAGP